MKLIIALFLLQIPATLLTTASAQSNLTGWLASFNTFKTGKKTSIHADIQLRSTDEIQQVQTLLIRPGLNFHLNKTVILTAGYAYISNKRIVGGVSGFADEHRIWQQLLINHKIKTVAVSHRFRLEQRFIAKSTVVNNELENDGSIYGNRIRYFFRNVIPFSGGKTFSKGVFGALQNEVFANFASPDVNDEFFDQNRLYIAAGYRLNPRFDLEAGYMNQYINGRGKSFTNNHVMQLAAYLRL